MGLLRNIKASFEKRRKTSELIQETKNGDSIGLPLEMLNYMDEAMDRLNNSRATQIEQAMASQMAGKILSEMREGQQSSKRTQFTDSLKEEVDSKEIAENARRQEIKNEYIRNHPYARIMDELLRHVKAKEEGRESTYSGTSKESILAQYRYDNYQGDLDEFKLDMFIAYLNEIRMCGGSYGDEIPKSVLNHMNKRARYMDFKECVEQGILHMRYYEILDVNEIKNLEYVKVEKPSFCKDARFAFSFSDFCPENLKSLPTEYERYISGNTK